MPWARRAWTVGRVWGIPRTFAIAIAIAIGVQLLSTQYVGLPSFEDAFAIVDFVPPLAAIVLIEPLIDQTKSLTATAQVPLLIVYTLRYLAVQACGIIVALSIVGTPADSRTALLIVPFLGCSAVAAAMLDTWFWIPILGISYGWLQFAQSAAFSDMAAPAPETLPAMMAFGGALYVGASTYRSRP